MTTKPFPSTADITNATSLAIASGNASDYAIRAFSDGQHKTGEALNKLSLRFAELALEALGGEAGQAGSDEAASA